MSEVMGGGPEEMRRRLLERSVEDEGLRRRLLDDPKGTIEHEIGAKLPEEIDIRVVEETPETLYLVLPPKTSTTASESGELSARELEAVAGGGDPDASKETLPLCTVGEGCWKPM